MSKKGSTEVGRPKGDKVPVSTRIPRYVHDYYQARADLEGKSLTAVLERALSDYMLQKEVSHMSPERLYQHPALPQAFAAFEDGKLVYWFNNPKGWDKREPAVWSVDELRPLPLYYAVRTGWPGAQLESKLFEHRQYKDVWWVAIHDDDFWIFPQQGSWKEKQRSVYRPDELVEVNPSLAKGTGWPGAS